VVVAVEVDIEEEVVWLLAVESLSWAMMEVIECLWLTVPSLDQRRLRRPTEEEW
jgi:hypothetical protein